MLLLAYLEGESKSVPAVLQPDLKFVLQKTPVLLEEMLKIAVMPRPPHNHGWLVCGFDYVWSLGCVCTVAGECAGITLSRLDVASGYAYLVYKRVFHTGISVGFLRPFLAETSVSCSI